MKSLIKRSSEHPNNLKRFFMVSNMSNPDRKAWVSIGASTLLVTFFLFFIDEGYYDLRWMRSPGNWIAFAVYCLLFFTSQMLFASWVLRRLQATTRLWLSILSGVVAVLILVFGIAALR